GCCFFFQAEDGIRYWSVTGVQTCALPIWMQHGLDHHRALSAQVDRARRAGRAARNLSLQAGGGKLRTGGGKVKRRALIIVYIMEIGRASCRERGESWVAAGACDRKEKNYR